MNWYPSECVQTPFTSDHPDFSGAAGTAFGTVVLSFFLFFELAGNGSAFKALVAEKLVRMARDKMVRIMILVIALRFSPRTHSGKVAGRQPSNQAIVGSIS